MWKNKVKAFTIPELMVVLVLSTIVLTMSYSALDIVNQNFKQFNERGRIAQSMVGFNSLMASDFENAEIIMARASVIKLEKNSAEVTYEFTRTHIVRSQSGLVDSIDCKVENLEFYFLDQTSNPFRSLVISELKFHGTFGSMETFFNFHKEYAANTLLLYSQN